MSTEATTQANIGGIKASGLDIGTYFRQLQSTCGQILDSSLSGTNSARVAVSHQLGRELEVWCKILCHRRESELLKVGTLEYEFALLALAQGHYRHAFKGLRLVLELILQAVYLSMNELRLREWLDNRFDTSWNAIVDQEEGLFSQRVAKAFFPDLTSHVQHYRGLALSVYKECSECVHGNTPKYVPLPSSLQFDQEVFNLWHSKAELVALVVHFALSLRYLNDLLEDELSTLEAFLSDRLGHLNEIRGLLGGPTKA